MAFVGMVLTGCGGGGGGDVGQAPDSLATGMYLSLASGTGFAVDSPTSVRWTSNNETGTGPADRGVPFSCQYTKTSASTASMTCHYSKNGVANDIVVDLSFETPTTGTFQMVLDNHVTRPIPTSGAFNLQY